MQVFSARIVFFTKIFKHYFKEKFIFLFWMKVCINVEQQQVTHGAIFLSMEFHILKNFILIIFFITFYMIIKHSILKFCNLQFCYNLYYNCFVYFFFHFEIYGKIYWINFLYYTLIDFSSFAEENVRNNVTNLKSNLM